MITPAPRRRAVLAALALGSTVSAFAMNSHLIFLGTYTRDTPSRGIYSLRLDDDTGALTAPVLAAETPNPTWVTLSPDRKRLYTIHPSAAQAVGYQVNPETGQLAPLPTPQAAAAAAPSHLAFDATGRTLLAANYADGFVAALPVRPDGTLGAPNIVRHSGQGPNPQRQEKPHVHSVTLSPDNRFVLVCDLGLDRIYSYALDAGAARLTPADPAYVATAPGAGPRHFKFGTDGRHAYALTEMGATVIAYDYAAATGTLTPIQDISTLPGYYQARWAAEVRIHPNGRFLYASNRGHDSLAVFSIDPATGRLSPVEIVPTGGKVPRNFALSPNGKWLVCGHQDSDRLTVFRVDPDTGKLIRTPNDTPGVSCVCVLFYD